MSFRPTTRLLVAPSARLLATPSSRPPPPPSSIPTTLTPASPRANPTASAGEIPLPPRTKSTRVYVERKAYLHAYYSHLLEGSQLVLLFKHDNLSAGDSERLRIALKRVPLPKSLTLAAPPSSRSASSSSPSSSKSKSKPSKSSSSASAGAKRKASAPESAAAAAAGTAGQAAVEEGFIKHPSRIKLTVTRTGVFGSLDTPFKPYLTGQTAILTCPSISPPYLTQVLRAVNRAIKQAQRDNVPAPKQPRFQLVVGLLEGTRLMAAEEVEQVAKLDELDTLRSMVIGLLQGTGRNLLGTLQSAGGGGLVRTLQGLEKDLKDKQGGGEASA